MDLANENREVITADVRAWCEKNGQIPMIETSAKDAINVDMAFSLAVERWNKLEEFLERSNDYCANTVDLSKHIAKENVKKRCCS